MNEPKGRWHRDVAVKYVTAALVGPLLFLSPGRAADGESQHWFRGNTHAHTLNSDGNATPDVVARWYREHGYHFLVITDHEFVTDAEPLNKLLGAAGKFLVISGQEVTQRIVDVSHADGIRQAHVNAIDNRTVVMPLGTADKAGVARDTTMRDAYERNVAAIQAAGGLAQINHANYRWSVRPEDLFEIPNGTLLEIWNGCCGNLGGTDESGRAALSLEALWDVLLSRGQILWGVGVDDSHDFTHLADPYSSRPGQAWIMVRAPALTPQAIKTALAQGDFYASTGVSLASYASSEDQIAITIQRNRSSRDDTRYMTRFIGKGGKTLSEVPGAQPRYRIQGNEGYVRASIVDSDGKRAWTQPLFLQ